MLWPLSSRGGWCKALVVMALKKNSFASFLSWPYVHLTADLGKGKMQFIKLAQYRPISAQQENIVQQGFGAGWSLTVSIFDPLAPPPP